MSHVDPDLLYGAFADLNGVLENADNIQTITTNGADPVALKTRVTGLKDALGKKRIARDDAKVEYEEAQHDFAGAAGSSYDDFSNLIDTISGALGKKTPAGKQVLAYRKHVTGSDKHQSPTPAPTPSPTPPSP